MHLPLETEVASEAITQTCSLCKRCPGMRTCHCAQRMNILWWSGSASSVTPSHGPFLLCRPRHPLAVPQLWEPFSSPLMLFLAANPSPLPRNGLQLPRLNTQLLCECLRLVCVSRGGTNLLGGSFFVLSSHRMLCCLLSSWGSSSIPADLPISQTASQGEDSFPFSGLLLRSAGPILVPFYLLSLFVFSFVLPSYAEVFLPVLEV